MAVAKIGFRVTGHSKTGIIVYLSRPAKHTPESILSAALDVFHLQGVGVSMADIASAASVSNGTLFNYFATKQDLLDALYVWVKSDLATAVGKIDQELSICEQMHLVWNKWLEWAFCRCDAHAVMNLLHQAGLASEAARAKGRELIAAPMQVLGTTYASGVLVDLPLNHLVSLIEHHLDQAVASDLNRRERDVAFQVLWNGITK